MNLHSETETSTDLEHWGQASDVMLMHHVSNLIRDQNRTELFRLLLGNRAWIQAKFERFGSDVLFLDDVSSAIAFIQKDYSPNDFLPLLGLCCTRLLPPLRKHPWSNRKYDLANSLAFIGHMVSREQFVALSNSKPEPTHFDLMYAEQFAVVLVDGGYFDDAIRFVRTFDRDDYLADTLRLIGEKLLEKGLDANDIFNEAWQAALKIPPGGDTDEQAWELHEIVLSLLRHRQFDKAEPIIASIDELSVRSVSLAELAISLVDAGHDEKAEQMINQAQEVARQIPGYVSSCDSIRPEIALALAKVGHNAEALNLLLEARHLVFNGDGGLYDASFTLRQIAIRLAQVEYFEEALRTVTMIEDMGKRSDWHPLGVITILLAKAGFHEKAEATLRLIREHERATNKKAANEIPVIEAVIKQMRLFDEARIEFDAADIDFESKAAHQVARALFAAGYFPEALEVVAVIPWYKREEAASNLAKLLFSKRQDFEACQLIGSMPLDHFLESLAACTRAIESIEPGLVVRMWQELVRLIAWIVPEWADLLPLIS